VTEGSWCRIEGPVSDGGDAVGDGDAGEVGAAIERRLPDGGDAVGDGDRGEAGAAIERRAPIVVTLSGMVTEVRLVQW